LYWEAQAKKRGWVVISPAAPEGTSLYTGGETDRAFDALGPLKGIPVAAFVGAKDSEWMRGSQDSKEKLDALGVANTLDVVPGAALVLPLDPAKLFDRLDQRRPKNAGFYRADSKSQPYILLSHQA
jgi:hypothetical protein